MPISSNSSGIVPAHLAFFTIYNPSLGGEDEILKDELVYFFDGQRGGGAAGARERLQQQAEGSQEEENRQLRSVGLAKGMIQFSEGFAKGDPVDCIETDKSRTIIHNLDGNWWLLASVTLTCLPRPIDQNTPTAEPLVKLEYSSREVAPATLLLKQILRFHSIFLLHHGTSLADLWQRTTRDRFCSLLRKFWDPCLAKWDVMLHSNPASDIFDGINISGGGELGIGVGEEAWGSGEREVLEGFVQRTEGLIDIVVSRFDHLDAIHSKQKGYNEGSKLPISKEATGGVIFSGLDIIARPSIRAISAWMEVIGEQGVCAYGVQDNPTSTRPPRPRKERKRGVEPPGQNKAQLRHDAPNIPAPIVRSKTGLEQAPIQTPLQQVRDSAGTASRPTIQAQDPGDQATLSDEMMKYLTLGIYGSSWGIPAGRPIPKHSRAKSPMDIGTKHSIDSKEHQASNRVRKSQSRYLIGLLDDLEDEQLGDDDPDSQEEDSNSRISVRHLYVWRNHLGDSHSSFTSEPAGLAQAEGRLERVRTVIYLQHPFIFAFLFEAQTSSLALPLFYRSIHHQLGPLRGPLLKSTNPASLHARLRGTMSERGATQGGSVNVGHSLIYDPVRLTVHNSIPDIPGAASSNADTAMTWKRLEALSVHSQILNTQITSHGLVGEQELTSKTSRGWWVVWMRIPHSIDESGQRSGQYREAILLRKANDYVTPKSRQTSSALSFGFGRQESSNAKGTGIVDGVGSDVKQYIEALISLSR